MATRSSRSGSNSSSGSFRTSLEPPSRSHWWDCALVSKRVPLTSHSMQHQQSDIWAGCIWQDPCFPSCFRWLASLFRGHWQLDQSVGSRGALRDVGQQRSDQNLTTTTTHSLGQVGSAMLPFATGALSQAFGIRVLQPIIVSLLGGMAVAWGAVLWFTALDKKRWTSD